MLEFDVGGIGRELPVGFGVMDYPRGPQSSLLDAVAAPTFADAARPVVFVTQDFGHTDKGSEHSLLLIGIGFARRDRFDIQTERIDARIESGTHCLPKINSRESRTPNTSLASRKSF
jgi:hypothetical protein